MIAKVPEDIFEETGSPTIKNYATKFKHVSALLLDKGVYEVSLHPNRYTVILKEAATGEPSAVTCKACLASAEWQAVGVEEVVIAEGQDHIITVGPDGVITHKAKDGCCG